MYMNDDGRIKTGEHRSPKTEFKSGQIPWNKGIVYSQITGQKHPNWKGGKPKCTDCNKQLSTYRTKRCLSCHLISSDAQKHLHSIGFKKGEPSPRKGLVMTEEQKLLISINRSGKYGGDKVWNWKGGITSSDRLERLKFRRTLQPIIFKRDNYTCQICEQYGGSIQVDHIKSWAKHPELRFEITNCRTLCMACHYYVTFKKKIPEGIVWGHNLSRRITR